MNGSLFLKDENANVPFFLTEAVKVTMFKLFMWRNVQNLQMFCSLTVTKIHFMTSVKLKGEHV